VQFFLENQKRGICAGDDAMPVVIKAYSHHKVLTVTQKSTQEEKVNK
jgi:hypothetical protein